MKQKLWVLMAIGTLVAAPLADAAVLQVGQSAAFTTFESALAAAEDGDTIELVDDGGIYDEAFIIYDVNGDVDTLTVKAADGLTNKPIVRTAAVTPDIESLPWRSCILLTRDSIPNITIQGIRFEALDGQVVAEQRFGAATFIDCDFVKTGGEAAILCENPYAPVFENCTFQAAPGTTLAYGAFAAIYLTNATITNSQILGNSTGAVYVWGGQVKVIDSFIGNASGSAVALWRSRNNLGGGFDHTETIDGTVLVDRGTSATTIQIHDPHADNDLVEIFRIDNSTIVNASETAKAGVTNARALDTFRVTDNIFANYDNGIAVEGEGTSATSFFGTNFFHNGTGGADDLGNGSVEDADGSEALYYANRNPDDLNRDNFTTFYLLPDPTPATLGSELGPDGTTDDERFFAGAHQVDNDTDEDGLSDSQENFYGTDHTDEDTDNDGLLDGDEISRATNPLNPDTDGDGTSDGDEVTNGTNPLIDESLDLPVGGAGALLLLTGALAALGLRRSRRA